MTLNDEQKQKLKDFMLKKNNVNPETYIPIEDRIESIEYIGSIFLEELNKMMVKIPTSKAEAFAEAILNIIEDEIATKNECAVCKSELISDLEVESKVCNKCSAGWTLFKYPMNMKSIKDEEESLT